MMQALIPPEFLSMKLLEIFFIRLVFENIALLADLGSLHFTNCLYKLHSISFLREQAR